MVDWIALLGKDSFLERATGIEPVSSVWKTDIMTAILRPRRSNTIISYFAILLQMHSNNMDLSLNRQYNRRHE